VGLGGCGWYLAAPAGPLVEPRPLIPIAPPALPVPIRKRLDPELVRDGIDLTELRRTVTVAGDDYVVS
jgi:hypothetical protein